MIRYKQILICKLIGGEKKEPIGKILDVTYSDDCRRVTYLIVKNDNLINNKIFIPFEDIIFLDEDQILYLKDEKDLEEALEGIVTKELKLLEKEVRTEEGECIGYVKDFIVNKEDGFIEGFIITEGIFEDILRGRNYIPLFKDIKITENCICIPNCIFNILNKNNN
ncbi:uncharacterized protein YrrD [Keratinibaculum paraultunense]|uniref:Uncharacterized protein YrrD n=1 Tax=Keratinibaculum paraultunense TaxID=1278232 RepID=A0A4R3L078_9FIRM|nr:PRC-barrel domain-containing protein [Keratinibaculum paraultunense]QQY80559.1 PRC-barrel domain-containing protein [Keratinibaculum paraultunense]TCS91285.1 uncharacterized protein YrrD [Keratinibaculum paraultunense]